MSTDRQILPKSVKPSHYNVTLVPGPESLKFSGQVSVSIQLSEPSRFISINSKELDISSVSVVAMRVNPGGLSRVDSWPKCVTTHRATQKATGITYNTDEETATFEFEHEIPAVSDLVLHLYFEGVHNNQMAGFYRSAYKNTNGESKFMVTTQFEPSDCRRCFPCFDEPNLKATFDMTLYVPQELTALSNMNAVEESIVEFNGKTFKSVKFARTPIMSTYLVAICVGEYDYIEAVAHPKQPVGSDPITCRVYTLPGESQNGKFALDCCVKILEYFSEYFDCGYPLPKMDMIAIPEFSAGAMENWGLVTYRNDALLFDEATGSIRSKTQVASTVAHELAHQWFGNLVTMDWWDALWLNEGFATFVGTLAVDHVFPEWTAFTGFAANEMQTGLGLDGLRSSHPIEVAVNKPSDVIQIFDAISYCKGASVIRMLQSHIGAETFANGVKLYLQRHKFSNATTDDLWNALGEVAGIDVASMMEPWLHQMGYPLVSIEHEEYDEDTQELTLTISQKRYLSSGDLTEEEDASINPWHIPITIITDSFSPTKHMLTKKTDTISFPYVKTNSSFFKLNFGVTGFYRVLYNFDQLSAIGAAMKDNLEAFPIEDRLNIVSETFNFARAGLIGTDAALEILQAFESEDSQEVLTEIATRLDLVIDAFYKDETVLQEIQKLMRSIFSPKVSSVGYEYPEGEDYNNILKRNLIIKQAAKANDGNVLAELRKMFDDYFSDAKTPIHANLVPIVLTNALKYSESPESDFEKVLEFYKTATSLKTETLLSVGAINDRAIIDRYIDTMLLDTSFVLKQDLIIAVIGIVRENPQKEYVNSKLWEWLTTKWDVLTAEYSQGGAGGHFGDVFRSCFAKDVDPATVERVEAFIRGDHLESEADKIALKGHFEKIERKVNQGLESLKGTISWVERDSQKVHDWVLNNNAHLFN